ncbi:hypothetical protein BC939DRAFT_495125 [Gamsiella multidivaricata]|uniref:uncharacterized protein n=1 Tax=Gamsiella multidivaricata TaxID=101098 RepID=UPI00221E7568|nr:uncharacterized protein BC939DRAFT_495125 [Gamsiella multidivaricata]KAI7819608.1 hypothetical protein BC939DRAFT_495125 [Gamsiella multidivaricata]
MHLKKSDSTLDVDVAFESWQSNLQILKAGYWTPTVIVSLCERYLQEPQPKLVELEEAPEIDSKGNRNTNYKARKEDLEKLEKALYRSLVQIIQELPEMSSDQLDALRVYGIIFSGLKVEFLEARCIKGIVVVYSVYTGAVPDNIISVYGFADLLEMTVAFKRRIEKTIRHIMDLKVPPQ